jgi:hypothetical protein
VPGHESNERALKSYSQFTVNQTTPIMRKCLYTSKWVRKAARGLKLLRAKVKKKKNQNEKKKKKKTFCMYSFGYFPGV